LYHVMIGSLVCARLKLALLRAGKEKVPELGVCSYLPVNSLCVCGENLLQGKTTLWIHAIQSAVVSITAAWAFILGPPNLYIPQRMRVPFMCR
jgi:hypothetical protein